MRPHRPAIVARLLAATVLAIGFGTALGFAQNASTDGKPETAEDAVRATFAKSCVGCHQHDRLEPPRAAGHLANIIDLEALSRSPLVTRGDPDASRLYQVLHAHHAPLKVFAPFSETRGPSPDAIARVRDWIASLEALPLEGCGDGRRRVAPRAMRAAANDRLALFSEETAKHTRFLSLVHLWNACHPQTELRQLARGLADVLSALTWRPDRITPSPISLAEASQSNAPSLLFSFDLRDYGWRARDWDSVTTRGNSGQSRAVQRLADATGTATPIMAADAFAARAHSWPAYRKILRLPDAMATLGALAGVNGDRDQRPTAEVSLSRSPTTGSARTLRWQRGRNASLWSAQSGPESPTRAIFRLPNGAPAFAFFGQPRRTGSTPDYDQSPAACLSCHAVGPRAVRPRSASSAKPATEDAANPGSETDRATDPFAAFNELVAGDTREPQRIAGLDPVSRLIALHRAPVDLKRAAAELGLKPDVFTGILSERIASGDLTARRLSVGRIAREDFDTFKRRLQAKPVSAGVRAKPGADLASITARPRAAPTLTVWSDREVYAPGAPLRFKVHTDRTCYPTLIGIDVTKRAVVLFPNDFEPPRLLGAGRTLQVPGPDAAYEIKARETGEERVLAFCAPTPAPILATEPDYQREVFTLLGRWPEHLKRASQAWSKLGRASDVVKRAERRVRQIQRARRRRRRPPPEPVPAPQDLSRATFSYRVVAPGG